MTKQKNAVDFIGWLKSRKVELIALLVSALLVVIDQVTKLLVESNFQTVGETMPIIKGVLNFTYIRNDGAVFGSLSGKPYIFNTITVIIVVAGVVALLLGKIKGNWLIWTASLVIGGGIGNMIDRFRLKYVIDFIDVKLFGNLWVWVFNFADCCVVVGCIMLVIYFIADTVNDIKKSKEQKASKGDNDA